MEYKSTLEIIKRYRWQSIFFSYLKMMSVMILLPTMILSFLVYSVYISTLRKETANSFQTSSYKSYSKTYTELENFRKIALNLSKVPSVNTFMTQKNPAQDDSATSNNLSNVCKYLVSDFSNISYINSALIYSFNSSYVCSTTTGGYLDNTIYKDIITTALSGKKAFGVTIGDTPCTCFAYNIYTDSYLTPSGLLLVNINNALFHEYIFSKSSTTEQMYITNCDNSEILYQKPESPDYDFKSIFDSEISDSSKVYFQNSLFYMFPVSDHDVNIVLEFPNADNTSHVTIIIIAVGICLAAFIISLLLSVHSSMYLYSSVASIITELELGEVTSTGVEFNEIDFIKNNLLKIIHDKSNLEKELTEKLSALKQMQMIALQTQINPHFIFNTLNVVNLMILKVAKTDTCSSRIISLLSDIISNALKTKSFITTLEDEIDYAKKYIEIELIKNNYSFDVKWDIAPETTGMRINKFILQPILENSINHGFKLLKERHAELIIKTETKNKNLIITISDNGNGIDDENYEKITDMLNQSDVIRSSPHIGLTNVNQRIKLIHGDKAQLKLIRTNPGTTVQIIVPIN